MQQDQFIKQVQNRAHLPSRGDAEVATRAVLETLAERLAGNEAFQAAAQLPKGLAAYLQHEYAGTATKYTLDEFFQMVSQREGVELPQAVDHTRVVIEVLGEAISQGEINDIKVQLPPEFDAIFAGSQGEMKVKA
ncbi:hypothetical protein BV372_18165 [Nostoc sp. T09]|uniref:DUF2267 domain-containing protein n=1 Tax=Nostoc sp. T09 TaxID=1932621 RepID=UPI000A3907BC|nr:DUF2267 domain-containing protein [Nostoc sp. T09]OUL32851.1 hypothetical protein BV372_18165 [Nostoc sp. T09]